MTWLDGFLGEGPKPGYPSNKTLVLLYELTGHSFVAVGDNRLETTQDGYDALVRVFRGERWNWTSDPIYELRFHGFLVKVAPGAAMQGAA